MVEDLQTSYRESFGGDCKDLNNPNTTMNYFKTYRLLEITDVNY